MPFQSKTLLLFSAFAIALIPVNARASDAAEANEVPVSPSKPPERWQDVVELDFYRIDYWSLPPDDGNEGPFAWEVPTDAYLKREYDQILAALPDWAPGKVEDPEQRLRNLLYIIAVADVARVPIEAHAPLALLDYCRKAFPADQLLKLLCWIALHPEGGTLDASDRVGDIIYIGAPQTPEEIRLRTGWYAAKFIVRLTN
jgi:hypothetical protein